MKYLVQRLAGRMTLSFLTSRLAKAGVGAAIALIAATGAKADVVETFNLSGYLNTFLGPLVPFTGTFDLDFSNVFVLQGVQSLQISVRGRSVFTQAAIVSAAGSILAYNGTHDMLSLSFAIPGTWNGFNESAIGGGELIFGGLSGMLLGANGFITRDPADPAIIPPVIDPPPIADPPPVTVIDPPPLRDPPIPVTTAAVPELSTWVMMLVGLIGLGLVAKRRRAFSVRSERA